ncbi:hypothetical protein C8N32_104104 [Rhodovulum imhoffii]|uniref:Uncharacterized protein n=2 Tax=Rhodovulum imhoffii TaxID=365340 RepID=A0A2T5BU38_9RHOB|nr:hypothetical protein C8N32_104104 [Rhodovulum imhoffii]
MPHLPPETDAALKRAAHAYFAACRARLPGFVQETFGLRGSLRLHRHALGWDVAKAPVNLALSPVLISCRLGGALARRLGARRLGTWLSTRRILLPTQVTKATEHAILTGLLDLPAPGHDHNALAKALRAEPALAALFEQPGSPLRRALSDYTGTRSAVAEMTTALGTMGTGALALHSFTPGMVSLAPRVAAGLAQQAAIAAFPLGGLAGSMWYGLFPAAASPPMIGGALAALVILGAVVTAFAGVLADPVQTALGLHQRRLNRLIDAMEDAFTGDGKRAFAAREHYLARLLDMSDAGIASMRLLG